MMTCETRQQNTMYYKCLVNFRCERRPHRTHVKRFPETVVSVNEHGAATLRWIEVLGGTFLEYSAGDTRVGQKRTSQSEGSKLGEHLGEEGSLSR